MRVLVAGPCVSEFGWELMSWQGSVRERACAQKFDEVVICATRGHKPLYEDFCTKFIPHDVGPERDCHRCDVSDPAYLKARDNVTTVRAKFVAAGATVETIQPRCYVPIHFQNFVVYGNYERAVEASRVFDIIIHARHRIRKTPFTGSNWDLERWTCAVAHWRQADLRVATIGHPAASLAVEGAEDLRGTPLSDLLDTVAAAGIVVGPSSGPMHLASLCGAAHLVWTGKKVSPSIQATNRKRYEEIWNPHRTPVTVLDQDPNPTAETVAQAVEQQLGV